MRLVVLGAVAILSIVSLANADIVGWTCGADGDGAIVMNPAQWAETSSGNYDMAMTGTQYWRPAHVVGDFTTDATDPSVRLIETIDNATSFAWTGYKFEVGMTQAFSISTLASTLTYPAGWTYTITQPTGPQLLPNGLTGYLGWVDFSIGSGSAIAIGDSADFGLKFAWTPVVAGTVEFCTQQTPTPEPATMALLGIGALALIRRK